MISAEEIKALIYSYGSARIREGIRVGMDLPDNEPRLEAVKLEQLLEERFATLQTLLSQAAEALATCELNWHKYSFCASKVNQALAAIDPYIVKDGE